MIELRHLRCFVAVAEELSFRRAAERLSVAQPALSRTIRDLESLLGFSLLARTTRRTELTAAGEVFLVEARLTVAHAGKAVAFAAEAARGNRGYLTVAYTFNSISGLVPEIVTRFRARHPDVIVHLQEMYTDQQVVALSEHRIDVGFAMPALLRPAFRHLMIMKEPFVVAVPEHHPLAGHTEIELSELRDEPFVMGSWERWRHYREMVNEICITQAGFVPSVVQEEADTQTIFGLIAAGVGVSLLPNCVRNYHRRGLVIRPLREELPLIETVAAWHADNVTPISRNFIEIVRNVVAAHTPEVPR